MSEYRVCVCVSNELAHVRTSPRVHLHIFATSAIFLKKKKGYGTHSDTKFGRSREVLVIPMPGKNVSERRSGLRPCEKELSEQRFGAFRHKNTRLQHTESSVRG
jgi:hypothetical protein